MMKFSSFGRINRAGAPPSLLPSLREGSLPVSAAPRARRRAAVVRAQAMRMVEGCWVVPSQTPAKGIVHFLGGAFAGAAPQLLYPLIVQELSRRGYTVVAVPFPVSFQHRRAAFEVHSKFNVAVNALRTSGYRYDVPEDVPVYGVGHSMGSHLHLLIGSLVPGVPNTANILMSYNNKGLDEAIPIPGLIEALPSLMGAVEPLLAQTGLKLPSLEEIVAAAGGPGGLIDPAILKGIGQLQPAVDQIPSVLKEVQRGSGAFDPTPAEARKLVASTYQVRNTMFIKFLADTIDETPEMYRIVQGRNPSSTLQLELTGTHVTPCAQEVGWEVGRAFTPFDAVGMGVKALVAQDAVRAVDRMVAYMDTFAYRPQLRSGR